MRKNPSKRGKTHREMRKNRGSATHKGRRA